MALNNFIHKSFRHVFLADFDSAIKPSFLTFDTSGAIQKKEKRGCYSAACAGDARGYYSEYWSSWFNNRENDDVYYMFRSYSNCYYSSSEPVTDQEDVF